MSEIDGNATPGVVDREGTTDVARDRFLLATRTPAGLELDFIGPSMETRVRLTTIVPKKGQLQLQRRGSLRTTREHGNGRLFG